jgi:hypothetical protein
LRRVRCRLDNQPLFPEICAKCPKWFRRAGELFRRAAGTKQWREKLNHFSETTLERVGFASSRYRLSRRDASGRRPDVLHRPIAVTVADVGAHRISPRTAGT